MRALEGCRRRYAARNHGDTDIRLEQFDQIALRRNAVALVDVDAVAAQRCVQALGMFAVGARQELLALQVLKANVRALGKRVTPVDDELEVLGEKRPGVEPVPLFVNLGGNAELGFALLEKLADFAAVTAQEAEFQAVEQPPDLVEMRNQQRQVDGMGEGDPERPDFAALERRGELPGADGGLIALL